MISFNNKTLIHTKKNNSYFKIAIIRQDITNIVLTSQGFCPHIIWDFL